MTRDEAIAVLQEEIDGNLELTLREWRERDEQRLFPALRMAIEALHTPTDGDLIGREGILHELAELSDSYEKQYPREKEMIHGLILICRKAIVNYPSAEAVQGWIPLSHDDDLGTDFPYERDGEWVIVTDGKNISVERIKKDAYDHFFPNGRWFELEEVVAWRPLPKPYKRGGSSK